MARYIDADAWLDELKKEYTEMWESNCLSELPYMQENAKLQEAIMARPAADVVPRSEVAREIFAEITRWINRYWLEHDYGMPDLEIDFAELKKKYTEVR